LFWKALSLSKTVFPGLLDISVKMVVIGVKRAKKFTHGLSFSKKLLKKGKKKHLKSKYGSKMD